MGKSWICMDPVGLVLYLREPLACEIFNTQLRGVSRTGLSADAIERKTNMSNICFIFTMNRYQTVTCHL